MEGIFRILAYLDLEAYSEPWYIQKPRHIQSTVKHIRKFCKNSYLAHFLASFLILFSEKKPLKIFLKFSQKSFAYILGREIEKFIKFPEMEFSSIMFFLDFRKLIFEVKKWKKTNSLKQCLLFLATSLKTYYISGGNLQISKSKQKICSEEILFSSVDFVIPSS